MKKLYKRLFKTSVFRYLLVWLAANFIRLVYYTSRKTYAVHESARPYMNGELPAVFAFWHGRLMMIPMVSPPKRKMHVLISSHRDGEMIARTMHRFGLSTLRGSTSQGALALGKNAIKALRAGENIAITPDGPRGPAMKIQAGVVTIPVLAKVPVIPLTFSSSHNRRARSWDKFMIALPFGKLYYNVGAALWNASPEAIEQSMITLTQEADEYVRAVS